MLYADYTTDLLGLKDVNVTKVETIQGQLHIHLTTPPADMAPNGFIPTGINWSRTFLFMKGKRSFI